MEFERIKEIVTTTVAVVVESFESRDRGARIWHVRQSFSNLGDISKS